MDHRDPARRPLREPIRSPWVWVVMALIILGAVPFYLPTGSVTPLIAGVPYWLVVSAAFTVAFAAFTSWLCLRWWNLVEDEEENPRGADDPAARQNEGAARRNEGGAPWEN